jgi:hypothetical protein
MLWWVRHLNGLFAVLTDPGVFSDSDGRYRAMKHLHALATVEQLFERVRAIQSSYRDRAARDVLLFTVLDTLERLTSRPIDELCSYTRALKVLNGLRDLLPLGAANVLLPAAERAVEALREVQDGFFIRKQAGVSTIDVTYGTGRREAVPFDKAAAMYIRVLRNATHGHGTNAAGSVVATNELLAHHNGRIPHDLCLLGYLYLLDMLAHPQHLALRLYADGKV